MFVGSFRIIRSNTLLFCLLTYCWGFSICVNQRYLVLLIKLCQTLVRQISLEGGGNLESNGCRLAVRAEGYLWISCWLAPFALCQGLFGQYNGRQIYMQVSWDWGIKLDNMQGFGRQILFHV
jgi:hypothetical protein